MMIRTQLLPVLLLLILPACDNVGRAFDPNKGGGGGTATSTIQAAVVQGVSIDGRPKVREVFPSGNGWPATVPIVVEFNESVNESSVAPSAGTPTLFIREKAASGTGGNTPGEPGAGATPLAASYDFLMGGRVVVIRPTTPFDPTEAQTYEIVVTQELRDADGTRFGGSAENVIGEFTADKDNSIEEGEILTILPVDNAKDQQRETSVFAVFTKPVTTSTVTTGTSGNFKVQTAGGTLVDGAVSFPVRSGGSPGGGTADGRVLEFKPAAALAASTQFQIVVNDTILFGMGKLEFKGRTPFARFTTLAPAAVVSVEVGNPTAGAPDKVNRNNIASLQIAVAVPADTLADDRIEARVYGLDKDGGTSGALALVEAQATVAGNGAQTVTVDFTGKLGTLASPGFLEGDLTFAARLLRGSKATGYVLSPSTNNPALDVTPPALMTPAADAAGNRVLFIDQEHVTFYGTADDSLRSASLILDSTPAPAPASTNAVAFGFGAGGKFMFDPIFLARRTQPLGFSLTLTDQAGNESPAIVGTIVQRGVVTGAATGTTLVVEAFDDATFLAVAGATVLVDTGPPTGAAPTRATGITDASGRAMFTVAANTSYTITLRSDGYQLVTLVDSPARHVSLPMRPVTGGTATVSGMIGFAAVPGQRALLGCNIIADIRNEEITTTTAAATTVPSVTVRPNRPYVVTTFTGTIEPTATPAFTNAACSVCGMTGLTKEAAQIPIAPGMNGTINQLLLPATGFSRELAATYDKDIATWLGLDTTKLVGAPTVRVMASLFGLPQMTVVGVGFANQMGTTTTYTIAASYSLTAAGQMLTLGPKFWVSTEASDTTGNLTRHRRIIGDTLTGVTVASGALPGVPTITTPANTAFSGIPKVTYMDRLDATQIISGFAFQVFSATDSVGRSWRMIRQDRTGPVGSTEVWFPSGVTGGLATGSWSILAESHLIFSTNFGDDDYVLEEMFREEVTYSRAAAVALTIN